MFHNMSFISITVSRRSVPAPVPRNTVRGVLLPPSSMAHAERTPPEPKLLNMGPPAPKCLHTFPCVASPIPTTNRSDRNEKGSVQTTTYPFGPLAADCASGASRRYAPALLKTCPHSRHSVLRISHTPSRKSLLPSHRHSHVSERWAPDQQTTAKNINSPSK